MLVNSVSSWVDAKRAKPNVLQGVALVHEFSLINEFRHWFRQLRYFPIVLTRQRLG